MIITEKEFDSLSNTKMRWAGYEWEDQVGRFDPEIGFQWGWAYWFNDAVAMILAKNFLLQREVAFEVTFDEAVENYLIVTDYVTSDMVVA
jgi:hypothetical protein